MGASAPTDPPKPMVRALVRSEDQTLWRLILDSFLDTAWSTLVTPWPILSRTRYLTMSRLSSIPAPGSRSEGQLPGGMIRSRPPWMAWMAIFRSTAAPPQSKPVSTESSSRLVRSGNLRKRALAGPHTYLMPSRCAMWSIRRRRRLNTGRCCRPGGFHRKRQRRLRCHRPRPRSRRLLRLPANGSHLPYRLS